MEEEPFKITVGDPTDPKYDGEITQLEVYWVEHQRFLESRGYMLRERYRPGWVPSWKGTKKSFTQCPDGEGLMLSPYLMDAVVIKTGERVMFKRVAKDRNEFEIMKRMSSPPYRDDPDNRCIPLLDWMEIPDDPEMVLMVMPRFHKNSRRPYIERVSEVMDFYRQALEGLVFMHKHNLGHRDCSFLNMVMDADCLFPPDFDNAWYLGDKKALPRRSRPIKYYYIDFGHSSMYNSFEDRKMELFPRGQYKNVPELLVREPYDAFMLDVWCVGFMFYDEWLASYEFFDFMKPLVDWMMTVEPTARPTAVQALEKFMEIYSQIPKSILNFGLSYKRRGWVDQVIYHWRARAYKKWQASLSSAQTPHQLHIPIATS